MAHRTEKMGNKTLKWEHGQEMLVKCVMDNKMDELIKKNPFIGGSAQAKENGGYRFFLTFTDRDGKSVSHSPVCAPLTCQRPTEPLCSWQYGFAHMVCHPVDCVYRSVRLIQLTQAPVLLVSACAAMPSIPGYILTRHLVMSQSGPSTAFIGLDLTSCCDAAAHFA